MAAEPAAAGAGALMPRGIDILFATHNGARTLPAMIEALRALDPPDRTWRIIAVDNASTDETRALLTAAAASLPLTVLACEIPGKMPALRLGVREVRGDLTVFTDDDVAPDPNWLRALEGAADRHADTGLFGGVIRPALIDKAGAWFAASSGHHAELFAKSEHADGPVDAAAHIYGPNFMMRSEHLPVLDEVADTLGPTFAGRSVRTFPMGEDTQIMELLQARGVVARYVADAAVNHMVRGFQTDLNFMLARAERHGRGFAIRQIEQAGTSVMRRLARRLRLTAVHFRPWLSLSSGGNLEALEPDPATFDRLWAARWSNGVWRGAAFAPARRTNF